MKQMKITSLPNPFGLSLGNQIFGEIPSPPELPGEKDADHTDTVNDDPSDTESESISSENSLLTAMASVTVADSEWKSAPAYPPLYLSTASEYLPPQSKPHNAPHITDSEGGGKDISWASEAYEDSLEMDHVFERFTKRVGYEGEQCIRSVTCCLRPSPPRS